MAQTIEDVESRTLLQQFHALYKRQNDTDDEIDTIKGNIDNLEDEIERLDNDVIEMECGNSIRITDFDTGIYKLNFTATNDDRPRPVNIYYDGKNGSNYWLRPNMNEMYLFVNKTIANQQTLGNDHFLPFWSWHAIYVVKFPAAIKNNSYIIVGATFESTGSGSCQEISLGNGVRESFDLTEFLTSDDIGDVFTLKGSVATVSQLPASDNNYGDVYYVIAESVGYVWIHDTTTNTDRWEQLGLAIDLSNYVTQSELSTALNGKQNNLTAGNGIDITGDTISAEITEDEIDSGEATSGQVLTADGSGGASWQNAGGSGTQLYKHTCTINDEDFIIISTQSENFANNGIDILKIIHFIYVDLDDRFSCLIDQENTNGSIFDIVARYVMPDGIVQGIMLGHNISTLLTDSDTVIAL